MPHVAWTAHTKGSAHTARKRVSSHQISLLALIAEKGEPNLSLVYLDRLASGRTGWPITPLVDGVPDIENVTDALTRGPYGKCVYECDNDVCDNQVWTEAPMHDDR